MNELIHGHGRVNQDNRAAFSTVSSSLSMNEQGINTSNLHHSQTVLPLTRRNTSSAPSAQKPTASADSHSDSDSQFDSAMESHPNSDSESDPDLESQPQSPRQDKNVIEATMHPDVRHIHSTHRHSHVSEPSHAMSAVIGRDHSYKQAEHDLDMDMDLGQGLYGLSALAAASQQMPRREPFPQRSSASVHGDSNASESEG